MSALRSLERFKPPEHPLPRPRNSDRAPHTETSQTNASVTGNAQGDIAHAEPKLSASAPPDNKIPPKAPTVAPPKKGGMSYTTMGLGAGALAFGAYATNLGGLKSASDHFAHEAGDAVGGIVDNGEHLVGDIAKDTGEVADELKNTVGDLFGFISKLPYVITAVVLIGGIMYLSSGSKEVPMGTPVQYTPVQSIPSATPRSSGWGGGDGPPPRGIV